MEELQGLFETVRKMRSLKEPALPDSGYHKTLAAAINRKFKPERRLYYAAASVAAAALIFTLSTVVPFDKANIVHAMEQAYQGVKAYHGKKIVTNTDQIVNTSDEAGEIAGFSPKAVANMPSSYDDKTIDKPEVEVPVDLKAEEGDQKNADAGHSPWKLDPVFVVQVFVSLKISPQGIQGEYPVKENELKLIKSTVRDAIVEVNSNKTNIKKVYLKRLVRQDKTGIWTVVGYDLASK